MIATLTLTTILVTQVASHDRQVELMAQIKAERGTGSVYTTAPVTAGSAHDRQLELIAKIKAERASKSAVTPKTTQAYSPKSPSDLNFRSRLKAKRAGYRAFQAQQDAAEAAQIKAAKAEQMRMMPYMLEYQRQQTAAPTARYQADQRLAGDKAIANGLKGVTAPPY